MRRLNRSNTRVITGHSIILTGRPAIRDASVRRSCADVVSVLAMTMGGSAEDEEGKKNKKVNETLEYKLKGNYDSENVEAWGHEYMR